MFRKDWERCKSQERLALTILREAKKDAESKDGQDPVEKVGKVLWTMYKTLICAYRYYCLCGHEWFVLSFNEYMDMLNDCKIPDNNSSFCKCVRPPTS